MFKVIGGAKAKEFPAFNLASFTEEVVAEEQKKRVRQEEFRPDNAERTVEMDEFILGGFDFEYGGGYRRDEILKKTTDEADAIMRDAEARVQAIEQEASLRGFEAGLQKGREESIVAATALMGALKEGVELLSGARNDFYGKAEKEMIDLTTLIASEIVCRELQQDKSVISGVIRKAVQGLHTKQAISIRLNPADMEMAATMKEDLLRETEVIENVELKSDPAVIPGGCIMETNIGVLDATVENRLMNIRESLKSQIEK